jgi:hypothetical protein
MHVLPPTHPPPRAAGSAVMHVLPPLLYTLTLFNSYMTVQLPQGALLHWVTSSTFTLSLQLAMQQPAIRRLLGMPAPGSSGLSPPVEATPTEPPPATDGIATPPHPFHSIVAHHHDPPLLLTMCPI